MNFFFPSKKQSLSDKYLNIILIICIVTIIATLVYLISLKFNWYKTEKVVKKGEKETVKLGAERAAELLLFEAFSNSKSNNSKNNNSSKAKNNKTKKVLNKLIDNKKKKPDLVKKFAGIDNNNKPKEFSRLESVNKKTKNNEKKSFSLMKEKMKDIKNDLFIDDENQPKKNKSTTEEIMDEVENLNYDILDLNYLKSNLSNYWSSFDNKLMNSKSNNLDEALKKWGFMKEKFLEIFQ